LRQSKSSGWRNDDVFGDADAVQCGLDLSLLLVLEAVEWHYNQDIHVTVRPRIAARV
jgi:hypothetical protein